MDNRNKYDLSHLSHRALHIGRIQTLTVIPVEAGASLELSIDGIARLAPTRKEVVSECQVDIVAFHVPHRIVFGQTWIDFINEGMDEDKTFTGVSVGAGYRDADYLCLPITGATVHRTLVEGMNRIYHNYFAVPSFSVGPNHSGALTIYDWFPTTETGAANCRKYGLLAARLPHVLNGANQQYDATTGWEAQGLEVEDITLVNDNTVAVSGGEFTIQSLAQVQALYETEASRAWFGHFYQDIMAENWGSKLSGDVDPRNLMPEMLGRSTSMMSGRDIDGTDDATLGTFQGKTLERISFGMPRKHFAEHGFVFVVALMRYPLVNTREVHPLLKNPNPSYLEIAGDPKLLAVQPPLIWNGDAWLKDTSGYTPLSNDSVREPYGQWYRFQNNVVHTNFESIPGYPFSQYGTSQLQDFLYHSDEEFKNTFQTQQIGQAQIHAQIRCAKYSRVPGVKASIFAGVN